VLSKPKCLGGLGILDLKLQNECLLSKWFFKLLNENGLWQDLIKKKYLYNKSITQVTRKPGDSFLVKVNASKRTLPVIWLIQSPRR
jgi:hypothetical protein